MACVSLRTRAAVERVAASALASAPSPPSNPNEALLGAPLYGDYPEVSSLSEVGHYRQAYVGHVACGDWRATGASGGLARWFLASLLESGAVGRVLCVLPHADPEMLFRFVVADSVEGVRNSAGSAYYPVDLADALQELLRDDRPCAVIGLPCFIKAMRLACAHVPKLKSRVACFVGLVCGQLKSRYFAEYLIRSTGLAPAHVSSVSFREKVPGRPASNFAFQATTQEERRSLDRQSTPYSTAWVTGQFKPRACDLCDDVFAETADIVFMDAWLPTYSQDHRGTSIVMTRSSEADDHLRAGIARGEVSLEPIAIQQAIRSQAGVVQHKRQALAHRLWLLDRAGLAYPPKRVEPARPRWLEQHIVAALEAVRLNSHEAMRSQRDEDPTGLDRYHALMRWPLRRLALLQQVARMPRVPGAVLRRVGRALRRAAT